MLLRQRYLLDINPKMRLFVLCKTHSIGCPARPTYCMQPYILHGKKFVWDIRKILIRNYQIQSISSDIRWALESLESLNGRDSRCSHTPVRQSTDWSNTRSACSRVLIITVSSMRPITTPWRSPFSLNSPTWRRMQDMRGNDLMLKTPPSNIH
jgi:hypothetical protein